MEIEHKKKRSSILKKLESYLSINKRMKSSISNSPGMFIKSKSILDDDNNNNKDKKPTTKRHVAPSGCFTVCVGPEKERFVIKTEFANHHLFKRLLDDAESEYGFSNEGPLLIPCEVDLFCRFLAEMDCGKEFDDPSYQYAYVSCSPFNPMRRLGKSPMAKGCVSYGLLTPPRLLKINQF